MDLLDEFDRIAELEGEDSHRVHRSFGRADMVLQLRNNAGQHVAVCSVSVTIAPVLGSGLAHLRDTLGRAPSPESSFRSSRTLQPSNAEGGQMASSIITDPEPPASEAPVQLPPASPVPVHEHCRTVTVVPPPSPPPGAAVSPGHHQPPYRGGSAALSPARPRASRRGFGSYDEASRYGVPDPPAFEISPARVVQETRKRVVEACFFSLLGNACALDRPHG